MSVVRPALPDLSCVHNTQDKYTLDRGEKEWELFQGHWHHQLQVNGTKLSRNN
ncbi:MAG: hypothetical protein JOZ78_03890 [Chroococcidiopsidaceae cyanobacterium CP_BM_ER_R8_30]|nr:hypothetical protein [Chroococcidiopsidaceae cyanobacterium CP_BM_ER_R8_30]